MKAAALSVTGLLFALPGPHSAPRPPIQYLGNTAEPITLTPPKARAYREAGSIEGYIGGIAHDGFGRAVMTLRARVSGEDVKCFLKGDAYRIVRERQIAEVLDGRRVRVSGMIFNKAPRRIDHIEATKLEFLRSREELPSLADISDPDFTGGMTSEEYLEALRDGRLPDRQDEKPKKKPGR